MSSKQPWKRYVPWEPLKRQMLLLWKQQGHRSSQRALYDYFGINHRAYWRYEKSGRIEIYTADRICIDRLGMHPSSVYGQSWFDVPPVEYADEHAHTLRHRREQLAKETG